MILPEGKSRGLLQYNTFLQSWYWKRKKKLLMLFWCSDNFTHLFHFPSPMLAKLRDKYTELICGTLLWTPGQPLDTGPQPLDAGNLLKLKMSYVLCPEVVSFEYSRTMRHEHTTLVWGFVWCIFFMNLMLTFNTFNKIFMASICCFHF